MNPKLFFVIVTGILAGTLYYLHNPFWVMIFPLLAVWGIIVWAA
jgi:hypothetical protein